jgi:hypothetical protein
LTDWMARTPAEDSDVARSNPATDIRWRIVADYDGARSHLLYILGWRALERRWRDRGG